MLNETQYTKSNRGWEMNTKWTQMQMFKTGIQYWHLSFTFLRKNIFYSYSNWVNNLLTNIVKRGAGRDLASHYFNAAIHANPKNIKLHRHRSVFYLQFAILCKIDELCASYFLHFNNIFNKKCTHFYIDWYLTPSANKIYNYLLDENKISSIKWCKR